MTTYLYHGNCPDGFGAALAAWMANNGEGEYIPVHHGRPAPDVTGKDVVLMDFCYPVNEMKAMADQAKSLFVLDHHKGSIYRTKPIEGRDNVTIHIDTSRSGAVLAWQHFFPEEEVPKLFLYIEDRDCWFWKVENSRPILLWLDTQPMDFDNWQEMLYLSDKEWAGVVHDGRLMERKFESMVNNAVDQAVSVRISGHEIGMSFGTEEMIDDIGGGLAKRFGTAGLVFVVQDNGAIKGSFRGMPGFNVLALAEKLGGGGHPMAAGFPCPPHLLASILGGIDPLAGAIIPG